MRFLDPQYIFPLFLIIAGAVAAKWWPARRDVAAAGLADAQGWDLLIENLREEVERLQHELERERAATARKQEAHTRELSVVRAEVRRLQRRLDQGR